MLAFPFINILYNIHQFLTRNYTDESKTDFVNIT